MTGDELKQWRTSLGYSRREFARFVGRSPRTVEHWEQLEGSELPRSAERAVRVLSREEFLTVPVQASLYSVLAVEAEHDGKGLHEKAAELLAEVLRDRHRRSLNADTGDRSDKAEKKPGRASASLNQASGLALNE